MSRQHTYFVYIISSRTRTIYIGVTNDIERRLYEHKHKSIEGFSARYNIDTLVYYESFADVNAAIAREKEIKKWRRQKKNALIESMNPEWKDLSEEWGK